MESKRGRVYHPSSTRHFGLYYLMISRPIMSLHFSYTYRKKKKKEKRSESRDKMGELRLRHENLMSDAHSSLGNKNELF